MGVYISLSSEIGGLAAGVQKFRTQNRSGQPSDEVPPPPLPN